MNVMYIRYKFGAMSPLLPGEAILFPVEHPRAIVTRCAHSLGLWAYAIMTCLAVCVTGRRVLISCLALPPQRMEIDLWFPVCGPDERMDTIVSASLDSGYWGPCVEIRSIDPARKRHFFSAPELKTRVYCESSEELARVIEDRLQRNSQQGEPSDEYGTERVD
ncbi:MAG: hypothetical protein KJ060_09085 [Candidatus Hydrogenedentes bacterium]|nr:hypothetical protein [Candidatus Hydrogenedentota bacterium]